MDWVVGGWGCGVKGLILVNVCACAWVCRRADPEERREGACLS